MTLAEASQYASIFGSVVMSATAVGTVFVLFKTLRLHALSLDLHQSSIDLARAGKQSDVLLHCNERFSRVWEMRASEQILETPLPFYERFWSLQLDQFNHWKNGFVDQEVFEGWMVARKRQWEVNDALGPMDYQSGFKEATKNWVAEEFIGFMEAVHENGLGQARDWLSTRRSNPA